MKTVIVTGANSGIGKEGAKLLSSDNKIILVCRNEKSGNEALNEINNISKISGHELLIMDLSDASSIKAGADKIKSSHKKIDAIIHNAAIFDITQKEPMTNKQGIESVFFTNFIAPVFLTQLLMKELEAGDGARVITIGSKGLLAMPFLSIDYDNPEFKHKKFSITRNYYHSKLALLTWTALMSEKYGKTKMTFNAIRVPSVAVNLDRYPGLSPMMRKLYGIKSKKALSPEQMAKTYKYTVEDIGLTFISGTYFNEKNVIVPFPGLCTKKSEWAKLEKLTQEYIARL